MAPLTPQELQKHPEYEHTIWKLKPSLQGKVAVAKDRGGPFNIAYEVHGHGDRKLVVSTRSLISSYLRHQVSDNRLLPDHNVRCGRWLPVTFRFSRIDCLSLELDVSSLDLLSPHTIAILAGSFRIRSNYPGEIVPSRAYSRVVGCSQDAFADIVQWIMGLGGMKYAWQRQTKDFGHTQADKYSCLVYDNRGIGDSDKPRARYSTSEMAKDVIEVMDHLGWNDTRQLHVIGISMGGMIAQEVVSLRPRRIECYFASVRSNNTSTRGNVM